MSEGKRLVRNADEKENRACKVRSVNYITTICYSENQIRR